MFFNQLTVELLEKITLQLRLDEEEQDKFFCGGNCCCVVAFLFSFIKSYGKNRIFGPKTEILGPKHPPPLLDSNHVLATTGKSCSKKKSAFAQIIKGGNVILGDFLG